MSRSRVAQNLASEKTAPVKRENKVPTLESLIDSADYTGALALCEFNRLSAPDDVKNLEWLAYCAFHLGEHGTALETYVRLLEFEDADPAYHSYAAACHYYLGNFEDAEHEALLGPANRLQGRILFHLSHKSGDEGKLMQYHQRLTDSVEDQLSLAAMHFFRTHYQEATDVYKRLLLEDRELNALNVYIALCYAKLDYYEVSLEILATYLQTYGESALATNVKACNYFRLYDGKAAEAELKILADKSGGAFMENELVRHNLVVFRGGEDALRVLPPLVDVIPEARLNLIIHHLKVGDAQEAHRFMADLKPQSPGEYIIKAVVHASLGQQTEGSVASEHLKLAQQNFQLVGASPSECDTIPGRQCMASCYFLMKQFDDVLVYLKSIKSFFANDDDFNWNYGIACAAVGEFAEAEQALMAIANEKYKEEEIFYVTWLARCHINTNKPRLAWDLYMRVTESNDVGFALLRLIANECYTAGQFLYAARAFDVLERFDSMSEEYWEGKRGACIGVFQQCVAGEETAESLAEVLSMLAANSGGNQQAQYIIRVIETWQNE